jgi:hypothetical protein
MCNPKQAMLEICKRRAEESSNNAEGSQPMNSHIHSKKTAGGEQEKEW